MQVGPFRLQFHGFAQFGGCGSQVAAKAGDSSQSSMSIRVFGSQTNGGARLGLRLRGRSPLLSQRIGQIHMRLREIWFQSQGDPELRNASAVCPCDNSTQPNKIVSFGAAGGELYELFEGGAGLDQIATLHRCHSLAVEGISLADGVLLLGESEETQ